MPVPDRHPGGTPPGGGKPPGYCLPKIAQMLVEDYGLAPEEVTYRGAGSPLFTGRVKE